MPAKAKLTTRSTSTTTVTVDNLAKGTELSFNEADSNFINLRDQSFAISDGATTTDIEAGETITFSGASVSGNTVTITGGGGDLGNLQVNDTTLSPITTNDNLILTANGTGQIEVAGFSIYNQTYTINSINTNITHLATSGSSATSLMLKANGSGTTGNESKNSIYLNSYSGKYYLTKGQETYCMITTQGGSADAGIQIVGGGETGGIVVDDSTIQFLDPISGSVNFQNAVIAAQHKTPYINIEQNKIQTVSTNVDLEIDPSGTGTVDFILPTSATIGANGSASALTANPVGYLKIKVNGTEYQIPYYNI